MLISAVVLMVTAVVLVGVNEAAARGRLGINGFAGIRFGSLMLSERAWREGHRAARVAMVVAGAVLFATGITVATGVLPEQAAGEAVLGAAIVTIVLLVVAALLAKRTADRVLVEDSEG
jgi:low temperature requirement protein LtrA